MDRHPADRYRHLDARKIEQTANTLRRRVEERFPDSGLARVCAELEAVIIETEARCRWIAEPKLWLRFLVGMLILIITGSLVVTLASLQIQREPMDVVDFIQTVEAGINDVVLIGLAVVFLIGVESRIKRSRALKGLHELRSLAHVIDMHQLTKDPERLLYRGPDTPSSPRRQLSPFRLVRYLDYCSEMLSLVGKAAALYGQYLEDPVILGSVQEIEGLTSNMSGKIWQKIDILEVYRSRLEGAATTRSPSADGAVAGKPTGDP